MNEFIKLLFSLSVSGTLLFLLILGLKPLYRDKFSRRWQYYIWVIVALRFLLPVTLDTSVIGNLFVRFDAAAVTDGNTVSPAKPVAEGFDKPVFAGMDNSGNEKTQTYRSIAAAVKERFDGYNCLFFLWAAVALVLFIRKWMVYQRFIRCMKAGSTEISDLKMLNLLSACQENRSIRTQVRLYDNPSVISPVMTGFFCPKIILPARSWQDEELNYIFMHELTHYKQKDMFYKWLIQIVVCVHWFNPFVYLLEKEVNQSCELSCDEKVISVFDEKARREYGDMLLSFLQSDHPCKSSPASVTLTEGAEQLKERLGAIMKWKKKSKGMMAVTAVFTVAVGFCFHAVGAYAAPSVGNNNAVWKDSEIQNEMLTEDGVYYIFCEGAKEKDKPQASVSTGSTLLVIVRKGSYTSVGPFNNKETLVEDVREQCKYIKNLAEKEKKLLIETAAAIRDDSSGNHHFTDKISDMTIIHESADILRYENGAPYIHDILTNNTDRTIVETQYCMSAYNKNGMPLKLNWNFLDNSTESSFEHIVRTKAGILSGQTENYHGGWSLYDGEMMGNDSNGRKDKADQAAYALLCLKQVVFDDGTVWNNPDYESWFKIYVGKVTNVEELENYYPHEYRIKTGEKQRK